MILDLAVESLPRQRDRPRPEALDVLLARLGQNRRHRYEAFLVILREREDELLPESFHLAPDSDQHQAEVEVLHRQPEQLTLAQAGRRRDRWKQPELLRMRLDDALHRVVRPGNDLGEPPARLLDDLRLARVALDQLVSDCEFETPVEHQERAPGRGRTVGTHEIGQPDGDLRRQNALDHPPPEYWLHVQPPLRLVLDLTGRVDSPRLDPPRPDLVQPHLAGSRIE
ncbi:MAG TPA: hypothetical protein VGL05_03885 [Kribbella sp.]